MKRDNFFIKLKNNLYNLKTFPKYVKEGFGRAVLYGFILFLIVSAIQGVYIGYKVNEATSKTITELESSKNEFSIKDGVLNLSEAPIKVEEAGALVYADNKIDLNNASEVKNQYPSKGAYVLILKDGLEIEGGGMNQTFKYTDLFPNGLTKQNIIDQVKYTSKIMIPVAIIMFSVFNLINTILDILIVTAIGVFISMALRIRTKFKDMASLTIYAMTPIYISVTPINMLYSTSYSDLPLILGTIVFIFFILRDIKSDLVKRNN